MKRAEAAEKLDAMVREGLINRARVLGLPLYMAAQFVMGIFEFHVDTLDRELAELMEEYFPSLAKAWRKIDTPGQARGLNSFQLQLKLE